MTKMPSTNSRKQITFDGHEFTVRRSKPAECNRVKVSNSKGLANHIGPELCTVESNFCGEALAGEQAGRVLSLESVKLQSADGIVYHGRQHCQGDRASPKQALRGLRPLAYLETLRTGIGRARVCPEGRWTNGLHWEV